MSWDIFMSWQFGMTLLAALAIGIWQFMSIRRSREKRGEHGHVSHPPATPDGHNTTDTTAPPPARRP